MQVVADLADSGDIQIFDQPEGANLELLSPTDEVGGSRSQFGRTVSASTTDDIGTIYTPPPTFTFEDLGLVLKVTPFVHGPDEVSLEVEAEFKVLGAGSFNGVPVISMRKFQGKVRLRSTQAAVVAGLVSDTDTQTLTGIPGLANIPVLGKLFSRTGKSREKLRLLIVITPKITGLPASEFATNPIWVGSETRPVSLL
jgi:Flp pilus assembly secretin CpaC